MRKIGTIIIRWIQHFWLPLSLTVAMLSVALTLILVLLNRDQVTVAIPNIPIHKTAGVTGISEGVLNQGEHLTILDRRDGWYEVRRDDESKGWVASWLVNRTKPLNITPLSETTIVLDPGHGGSDSGALSTGGKEEKTYTLQLAKRVQSALLATGARVLMTRSTDKTVYLDNIPLVGEQANANAEISFHFDSSPEENTASGFTAYYYHKNNGSNILAKYINDAMAPKMPLENRGVEFANYLVLRENKIPAILLENGYINSDHDFSYIEKPSYQTTIAKQITVGLNNYFSDLQKNAK
ncbi:N-acetylmuramoyl-L-alanine amidase [Weissella oryzae SG25]|uniref:N-acetylmuramoyl-L-alanine amidase n=1 Tax=Weissella oryzae (strain DSM 25784 / JCM 18191 / LMG 30913 / SG25) TaxID=1329250 RepID=A0A069CS61_WEIOS|nr:N-acetylmuramoyl-L-alanine amidase [Weissella oryzae]GAK30259.1 N-acetylmuramoyl-L-alanine amidase [Weissella oryzae SG25]